MDTLGSQKASQAVCQNGNQSSFNGYKLSGREKENGEWSVREEQNLPALTAILILLYNIEVDA